MSASPQLEERQAHELARAFYANLPTVPLVEKFYTGRNRDLAAYHLGLYLIEISGGERLYTIARGMPRMGLRHMPFPIGPHHLESWLALMARSARQVAIPETCIGSLVSILGREGLRMLREARLGWRSGCPLELAPLPDTLTGGPARVAWLAHEDAWKFEREGAPMRGVDILNTLSPGDDEEGVKLQFTKAWLYFRAGSVAECADLLGDLLGASFLQSRHPMTVMSWGRQYAQTQQSPIAAVWKGEVTRMWKEMGY